MKYNKIICLSIIGMFLLCAVGNLYAGEVGLWISAKNDGVKNGASDNTVYITNVEAANPEGYKINLTCPSICNVGWTNIIGEAHRSCGSYMKYNSFYKASSITVTFEVDRDVGITSGYRRHLQATVKLPVDPSGWICGISKNTGGTGLYFVVDKFYANPDEDKMDRIHCFFNDREMWYCDGGKFHEPQTFEVKYPNGQDWT